MLQLEKRRGWNVVQCGVATLVFQLWRSTQTTKCTRQPNQFRGSYGRARAYGTGRGRSQYWRQPETVCKYAKDNNFLARNCDNEVRMNRGALIIDSGATKHMVPLSLKCYLQEVEKLSRKNEVRAVKGQRMIAEKERFQGKSLSYTALIV